MTQQSVLQKVIDTQKKKRLRLGTGFLREILPNIPFTQSHALIITGIRRCGKSTLLQQMLETDNGLIISFNQQDAFMHNGKRIEVLPAWKFLIKENQTS